MMSQTNFDYSFQITAPLTERAPSGTPAASSDRPPFDDHLAQASELPREAPPKKSDPSGPVVHGDYPNPESHRRLAEADRDEPQALPTGTATDTATDTSTDTATNTAIDIAMDTATETATDIVTDLDAHCKGSTKTMSCGGDGTNAHEDPTEASNEPPKDDALATAIIEATAAEEDVEIDEGVDQPKESANETVRIPAAALPAAVQFVDSTVEIAADPVTVIAAANRDEAVVEPADKKIPKAARAVDERAVSRARQPLELPAARSAVKVPAAEGAHETIENAKPQLNLNLPEQTNEIDPVAVSSVAATEENQAERKPTDRPAATPTRPNTVRETQHEIRSAANPGPTGRAPAAAATGAPSQPRVEKSAPAIRRMSEKSKPSDEAGRSANSNSESRADAPAGTKAAAPAIVNGVAAPPVIATTAEANREATEEISKSNAAKSDLLHPVGRSHRANTGGVRAGKSADTESAPRVDATRFVGRVAKAVRTAQERGGALQLRLSPPELGSLRLELTVQNGVLTAAMETETAAARQVLLDHLPALRDRLAEQNIRIERFEVDVRQEGSGGQPDARASQHQQGERQAHQTSARHAASRPQINEPAQQEAPANYSRPTTNGINLLA